MLTPRESESRELKDLSGLWRFKRDLHNEGLDQKWFLQPLRGDLEMPVPASYNDITTDNDLRMHLGLVWYERDVFVPPSWAGNRIVLRFGSVTHQSHVYINGRFCMSHQGGFLPFEAEVGALLKPGESNRITVAADNRLTWQTLPTGEIKTFNDADHPPGYTVQESHFDFFNYAGIHRAVYLYTTPKAHLADITTRTTLENGEAHLHYAALTSAGTATVEVALHDPNGHLVAQGSGAEGVLVVKNPQLWGPRRGILHTLMITVKDSAAGTADVYRLPVGLRTVRVTSDQLFVNDEPVYLQGFGRHEDSDFRGRGYDPVIALKDLHLLDWIGANSFRTSHYPYAEEHLELADRHGLLVIDEVPAVGMHFFTREKAVFCEERVNAKTQAVHIQTFRELHARDKNHPSVIMWSLANEAATYEPGARAYFEPIIAAARALDPYRPMTIAHCPAMDECNVSDLLDVVCLNRYYAWYFDPGHLELIEAQLERNLRDWHKRYGKPIIVAEYGADTLAGLHHTPPVMFSEEFQAEFLERYHRVFDRLDFVVGEHVWNFADFGTKDGTSRVIGNRKGVFTRQRQPKMAAHALRLRWNAKGPQKASDASAT